MGNRHYCNTKFLIGALVGRYNAYLYLLYAGPSLIMALGCACEHLCNRVCLT
jgi:hypothetical protein